MTAKRTVAKGSARPKKTAATRPASSRPQSSTVGFSEADGRPAVQAVLDNVPPAQRPLARRLDELIRKTVPEAVSAVKYRKPSQPLGVPFYGIPGGGWLVHMNPLKARVRLTFFAGAALTPSPPIAAPGGSRAIDIPDDAEVDEKQLRTWLQQAKKLPGWGRV